MRKVLRWKRFRFISYCPHISQTFRMMGEKIIRTTAGKIKTTSGKRSFTAAFWAAASARYPSPSSIFEECSRRARERPTPSRSPWRTRLRKIR